MQADALSQTFAALADPTRRAILKRLAAGPANVKELSRPFDMSGPAVCKHLRVLERAGLVRRRREAQSRPCELDPAPLNTSFRRHRVSTSRIGLVPLEPDGERLLVYLERRTPWDS